MLRSIWDLPCHGWFCTSGTSGTSCQVLPRHVGGYEHLCYAVLQTAESRGYNHPIKVRMVKQKRKPDKTKVSTWYNSRTPWWSVLNPVCWYFFLPFLARNPGLGPSRLNLARTWEKTMERGQIHANPRSQWIVLRENR